MLDERGQTTTEYILLLAAVVSFFLIAIAVLKPLLKKVSDTISKTVEGTLFKPESFHRFPIGR